MNRWKGHLQCKWLFLIARYFLLRGNESEAEVLLNLALHDELNVGLQQFEAGANVWPILFGIKIAAEMTMDRNIAIVGTLVVFLSDARLLLWPNTMC